MDQHSALDNLGEGRGLMDSGNVTVTFVPLIAVMATMVPKFLARMKNIRPTSTVSSREARHYFKEVIERELCPGLKATDYTAFPGYPNIFYSCELRTNLAECNKEDQRMTSFKNKEERYENFLVGRLSGRSGCLYMKLYQCPSEHNGTTTCPPPPATKHLDKSSDTLQLH